LFFGTGTGLERIALLEPFSQSYLMQVESLFALLANNNSNCYKIFSGYLNGSR